MFVARRARPAAGCGVEEGAGRAGAPLAEAAHRRGARGGPGRRCLEGEALLVLRTLVRKMLVLLVLMLLVLGMLGMLLVLMIASWQ